MKMSRLRFSDERDSVGGDQGAYTGDYRRGHSEAGGSDQGYIGGGEYRRGHRGAEARYRYDGYQESSYRASSGTSWHGIYFNYYLLFVLCFLIKDP